MDSNSNNQTQAKLTPKVLAHRCIGAASCVAIAPNTFSLNSSNLSTVINEFGDEESLVQSAAEACPVGAIVLFRNGKQMWPVEPISQEELDEKVN